MKAPKQVRPKTISSRPIATNGSVIAGVLKKNQTTMQEAAPSTRAMPWMRNGLNLTVERGGGGADYTSQAEDGAR